MQKYKVAIIGYGRFGALMYKVLNNSNKFEACVVSSRTLEDSIAQIDLTEAIETCDLVIPSVPISEFANWIDKIGKMVQQDSKLVICDVCSVKTHPVEVMQAKLPQNVGILATHPMWGPDSTQNGTQLAGLKFIYQIIRDNGNPVIAEFIQLWDDLKQEMIELSPVEHDLQAAYTHAFAFLIGKLGMRLEVKRNKISTKGFEGILYNQIAVENDTSQLFRDMFTYNPYAKEMLQRFQMESVKIYQELY